MAYLMTKTAMLAAVVATCLMSGAQAISPDAAATDPKHLGWMQGFPPAQDKLIMQPESDFFSFPKMRWTLCHIRELLPTRQISRGTGAPVALQAKPDPAIDQLSFIPLGGGKTMTWRESLAANYTDGMLVLHQGQIVYEHYSGCLDAAGQHR